MRRAIPLFLLFTCAFLGMSLVADERGAADSTAEPWIKQLADKDADKVCEAARALGRLRGSQEKAVPALKEVLKSRNGRVKWTAAEALWRLEHKADELVPVYMELLTALEPDIRAASAWRLGRLGSHARPAVPVLAAAIRDESYEVRIQVGQALANLGGFAKPALPALVRALGDERIDAPTNGDKGWESARTSPTIPALVELADDAIPLLIETFDKRGEARAPDDPSMEPRDWQVASRVGIAFPAFGPRSVAPLILTLDSTDAKTREYAALALRDLAQFYGLPKAGIDKLEKCLDDSNERVYLRAASALSWVRPSSEKAVKVLAKARGTFEASENDLLAVLERMAPHNEAARKLLLEMLGDSDAETAQAAHRLLARLEMPADQLLTEWANALSHTDAKVRSVAISALSKLGRDAKSVKTALHERLRKEDDHDCKAGILNALSNIDPHDPALVPLLIKALDDRESWVRWTTFRCLEVLGPRAKDALPALESRVSPPAKQGQPKSAVDPDVERAVNAIARIAPSSAKTAVTLLAALRNPEIRAVHCPKNTWYMRDKLEDYLLAGMPAAAPALREALKDEDIDVRRSAALVLVRAGVDSETAFSVLMEKLWRETDKFRESGRFQWRVVSLLRRPQKAMTPVVAAAWCKAWQGGNADVREILEVGMLSLQTECLPHLLEQWEQAKTPQAKRDLAHLLARFECQSKRVVPILREELREPQAAAQYAAAQALIELGPDAVEALPELLNLLRNPHPGMRAVAVNALVRIGRAARPAVPALKKMLNEDKPELRVIAANALSLIDPEVNEAFTLLRDVMASMSNSGLSLLDAIDLPEGLKDHQVYVENSIEESIARFGERAVGALAEMLDNTDLDEWSATNVSTQCGSNARLQAARLLARLGPEAKSAVPALVRALKDRDPFIRDASASALGRIGPAAKEAVPEFIRLLEEQNRSVSEGGAWSASSRAIGRFRMATRFEYSRPFDFRSVGPGRGLGGGFGFAYGHYDPTASIRPPYPHNPVNVLGRIDTEARLALPILREMAKDPHHPKRLAAALAMWRTGGKSPELIPAFTAEFKESTLLTPEMHECLADLDTQLKPAMRVMSEWLKQRNSTASVDDQVAVFGALGRLGTEARAEADVIRELLRADRWRGEGAVAAALALFQITGDKELTFPVLREVLQREEERRTIQYTPNPADSPRVHAARALAVLADGGDERALALICGAAKGDKNPHVSLAALEALARQKQDGAVNGLSALLRHADNSVRAEAALACGRLGARAKASEKALRVALEDSQLSVRQAARQALKMLE